MIQGHPNIPALPDTSQLPANLLRKKVLMLSYNSILILPPLTTLLSTIHIHQSRNMNHGHPQNRNSSNRIWIGLSELV